MKRIVFEQSAFDDFNWWAQSDRKMYKRIVSLIKETSCNTFIDIGKPEPLKNELK